MTNEERAEKLQAQVNEYAQRLGEWKEKFREDAAHAFRWAGKAFEAAARIRVYTRIVDALRGGKVTVYYLKEHAQEQVNRQAAFAGQSTSPCSNLLEREILAAWAGVLEALEDE
jgi:hypothetical protein